MTFAGFLQGEALLECYAAADIFALVSRREPWGVVVNEAAAFGLPLVLTDRGRRVGGPAARRRERRARAERRHRRPGACARRARRRSRSAAGAYGARSLELVEPWGYEQSVETFAEAVRAAAADRRR